MENTGLILENSPFYLLIFALLASGISWTFYLRGKNIWSVRVNRALFALRSILLFLLLLLLLSPLIRYMSRETENPIAVIAIDNSLSVKAMTDSVQLSEVMNRLQEVSSLLRGDYDVYWTSLESDRFSEEPLRPEFNRRNSDIRSMLRRIETNFEGRNLAQVLLVSDGIYNSGSSPAYYAYPFRVDVLALGDSTVQRDLIIQQVNFNKVSYEGNQFPIQVQMLNEGFDDASTQLVLYRGNRRLESRIVDFNRMERYLEETFLVEAEEQGMQRYTIVLEPLEGEFTENNNESNIFIEIVEGQEKILILARNPHPDIKALSSVIQSGINYSVELYIPGLTAELPSEERYDLLIYHHVLPDDLLLTNLSNVNPNNTATWIFYNRRMNLNKVNTLLPVTIQPVAGQSDQVIPSPNTAFSNFTFSDMLGSEMRRWPPVTVPFGDIALKAGSEALLFQQVGSIVTPKPLMVVKDEDPRQAVMLGEGLWRWRLHDYLRNESHVHFNEFVGKTIQFLSSSNETAKLRIYPLETGRTDQSIQLETEVYNDLYERIYGNEVQLRVTGEDGESRTFEYTVVEGNSRYRITGLSPGIYSFNASTSVGGDIETASGQFILNEQQIEYANLRADYPLLAELARSQSGDFFTITEIGELESTLNGRNDAAIIRSFESYESVINIRWVLILLIVIATTEWFLRKYHGAY